MRREAIALFVAAIVMLLLAAPRVEARATSLPLTACEIVKMGSVEKYWTDDDDIQHYRNLQWTSTFTGTFGDGTPLEGKGYGLLNWNLDLTTFNGDLFGEFNWAFKDFHPEVTFSGRFDGTFASGAISDDWVGHGGGMHIMGHGTSGACPGGSLQEVVILLPHG